MRRTIVVIAVCCWMSGAVLSAQTLIQPKEVVANDRPEAWVMRLVGSELQMTADVPGNVNAWSFEPGLEAGWLPSLDARQRLIGFNGIKAEDVNRTPLYVRPRIKLGLPGRITMGLGYIPPLRVGGIRPNHLSWSLGRPIVSGEHWRIGGRLHGQVGNVQGDITCDKKTVETGSDPVRNPFGCEAPSSDKLHIRAAGVEVGAAFPVDRRFELHVAAGWNYFHNEFQVNARYSGFIDRSRLVNSGGTVSFVGGAGYRLSGRIRLNADLFFTPLDVRRQGARVADGLLNLRVSVFYALK